MHLRNCYSAHKTSALRLFLFGRLATLKNLETSAELVDFRVGLSKANEVNRRARLFIFNWVLQGKFRRSPSQLGRAWICCYSPQQFSPAFVTESRFLCIFAGRLDRSISNCFVGPESAKRAKACSYKVITHECVLFMVRKIVAIDKVFCRHLHSACGKPTWARNRDASRTTDPYV